MLFRSRKQWNDFFSPMSVDNAPGNLTQNPQLVQNALGEFELSLNIGNKRFPEYPIRSHAEAMYQLKKALGVQASALHNFDINGVSYRDNKLVMAIDCEKVLGASWTGINTRAGDLLTVMFKYASGADATRWADRMHIVLHSDQILDISDTGVQVFD